MLERSRLSLLGIATIVAMTSVWVLIDMTANAGPDAAVSIDSGQVAPAGSITVDVDASGLPASIGGATIEVHYDPSVLDATGCSEDPDGGFDAGLCNATFDNDDTDPDVVRFNVASASGVSGTPRLAEITFSAVGSSGVSTPLDVVIVAFTDTGGSPIAVSDLDGTICITPCSSDTPTFTPTPVETTPSPPPTGQPTTTPTNTATNTPTVTPTLPDEKPIVRASDDTIPSGGSVTILIEALNVAPALGGTTVEVHYDPADLDAKACSDDPDGIFDAGVCNPTFEDDGGASDIVRFNVASATGVSGGFQLAEITFNDTGCTPGEVITVDVHVMVFTDIAGSPIAVNVGDGSVLCQSPMPTETPSDPTSTSTATPTDVDTPTPEPTRTPVPPAHPLGDVNKDGEVNAIDAQLILQAAAGLFILTNEGADVNHDGEMNPIDAALILQLHAGLLDSLPTAGRFASGPGAEMIIALPSRIHRLTGVDLHV